MDPSAVNKEDRSEELLSLETLNSTPDVEFDEVCVLAAETLGCPFALIALADEHRQWAKACYGLEAGQIDSAVSLCIHELSSDTPRNSPPHDHPLVQEAPFIRFYVGAPLVTKSGAVVGSLAVLSPEPRPGGPAARPSETLQRFAKIVSRIIDLRLELDRRHRAEKKLHLFRDIVNSLQDAVVVCDADPRDPPGPAVTWVNPAFTRMTGYTLTEMLGKTPWILRGPESSTGEIARIYDSLRRWEGVQATLTDYRKDGAPFWVEMDINPVLGGAGSVTNWVAVQRDVTRQVDRTRKNGTESQYRLLVESTNEMIWDLDLRTQRVFRTPALERLLDPPDDGSDPREWWFGAIHPEDRDRVRESLDQAIREKTAWSAKYRIRSISGDYLTVKDRATLLTDSGGAVVRVIGAMVDVTGMTEAQRKAEESTRQLELVLESTTDGVVLVDSEERVAYTNRRLRAMAGGRDITGAAISELYRDRQPSPVRESYELAKQRGEPANRNGFSPVLGVWVEAHAYPSGNGVTIFIKDISAQRQSALELEEKSREASLADSKLRRMFDQSIDMICIADSDGLFVEVSSAVRAILGYEEAELRGKHYLELLHPDDWEATRSRAAKLPSGESIRNFQNRYRRKDGRYVNLLWSAVWSEQDRLRFAIARDVTEQTEASRKLARSEANLARAQSIAHLGSWSVGIDDGLVEWSDEQYRIFGVEKLAAPRTTDSFFRSIHPEDMEAMSEARSEAILRRTRLDHEHRIVRPDGSIRYVHHLGELTIDPETGRRVLFGTTRDVTEQREGEARLRNTEARYKDLFEKHPHAMWVYDEETLRFLAVNAAAVRNYGYSEDEFLAMTILDIRPPEDLPCLIKTLSEPMAERADQGVWRHRTKAGGILFAEVLSSATNFGGRPARLVLATNVTEKIALEEQLRQSQKMEAVGQLAGGIAHDFNNLLTVINGYTDLLLQKPDMEAPRELNHIREAGGRAAQMTSQLLAFGRKQVLQPKLVNLNRLIAEMRPLLDRLIRESIEIEIQPDAHIGRVRADPTQLEQVLMNLAINSRDAMQGGGVLAIETAAVELADEDAARPPGCEPGPYVLLTVRDTGGGISEEVLPHIFEPFFTTKPKGQGTGLGLSVVYGIVKQSGGHIVVQSKPRRGTAFKVYLPEVSGSENDEVSETMEEIVDSKGTERVLVVEDDPSVREFVVAVLEDVGYGVLQASSGAEAILLAGREKQRIDLLLTDVVLPKMNGKDLADFLISQWPQLKVILMSGYPEEGGVRLGVLEPAMNFIAKPFTPAALRTRVREVLSAAPRRRRVLLVDDELGILALCRDTLEGAGYLVRTATDGRKAMESLAEQPVDLVITDLVMPEQEGIETIQQIRRLFPDTKIIAVSGFAGGSFLKVAQMLGADQVLPKPFGPDMLVAKVKGLVG